MTMSERSQITDDTVRHLHSLLSHLFAPIFEDTSTHGTPSTSFVFSMKELVDNVSSLFATIVHHLQHEERVVDMDTLLSPAVRILSVVQAKKRNAADDAQYKRLVNCLPELRSLAIDYSTKVLSITSSCSWNQRNIFLDKLLKHANNGAYLGDFFVGSGFVMNKEMNEILVKQVGDRIQHLMAMIKDVKAWEPPTLGRKRKKHASHTSTSFDMATFRIHL